MSLISKSLCNINLEAVIAIYTKDYHDYGQHRDIKLTECININRTEVSLCSDKNALLIRIQHHS